MLLNPSVRMSGVMPGFATFELYLLRRSLTPLLVGTVVVLVALLLERLLRLLDLVVNKGSPIGLILKLLLNLTPHYIGIALPAAFFLAVLVAVNRMSSDSELDAAQSFGIGPQRMLVPLLGLGTLLLILMIVVTGFVQPYSRYAYRALIYAITHATLQYGLEEGVFIHTEGGLTLMAEDISSDGSRLRRIFVHQQRPDGRATTTTAAEGVLVASDNDLRPTLRVFDGVQYYQDKDGRVGMLTFDQFNWPLDLSSELSPFRWRGRDERELTLPELWERIGRGANDPKLADMRAELHARLARSVSVMVLPFLAIPLGQSGRRGRKAYGFVIGLVILALYNNLLRFGEALADDDVVSPWLGIWLPLAALTILSFSLFYWTAYKSARLPPDILIQQVEAAVMRQVGRFIPGLRP
ncbi:MAG TPA: LPS export ABC transporter permease LptF [Alphaproteobacteria bacterium]|nr:LPS export ABC transporter permease LptF [Alphaproteobacteria bacterium]